MNKTVGRELDKINRICRNKCSTSVGGAVCRGCGRTIEEIRDWPGMTDEQKIGTAIDADYRRRFHFK